MKQVKVQRDGRIFTVMVDGGYPCIRVQQLAEDNKKVVTTSYSLFSKEQAEKLGSALLQAVDEAETSSFFLSKLVHK